MLMKSTNQGLIPGTEHFNHIIVYKTCKAAVVHTILQPTAEINPISFQDQLGKRPSLLEAKQHEGQAHLMGAVEAILISYHLPNSRRELLHPVQYMIHSPFINDSLRICSLRTGSKTLSIRRSID